MPATKLCATSLAMALVAAITFAQNVELNHGEVLVRPEENEEFAFQVKRTTFTMQGFTAALDSYEVTLYNPTGWVQDLRHEDADLIRDADEEALIRDTFRELTERLRLIDKRIVTEWSLAPNRCSYPTFKWQVQR
jgi:hypothetical protein